MTGAPQRAGASAKARARLSAAGSAFLSNARNADLRRAQLGFAGAWTAEWAFTVGLGIVAFRAGGAAEVGLVTLLRMLPSAVVAPLVAPLADRWRRERVLVWVSAVRAAATAGAAGLVAAGAASAYVYALAVLATIVATLYRPAHSALLPSLCRTPYELASANVVRGMLDSLATLIGPALAALLLGVSGVTAVFAAAAAASLWSALIMLRVQAPAALSHESAEGAVTALLGGLRAVRGSADLAVIVGLGAAQTFTRGALTVLTVVLAIDVLGSGEAGVGALSAAIGAGAVLGSVAAATLVGTRRLALWFGCGVALWGLPLALVGVLPRELVALAMLAVVGLGNALVDFAGFTLLARLAADRVLGRVFALFESAIALSVGVGSIVTPLVISAVGARTALVLVGAVAPLLVLASWRQLHRMDHVIVGRDRAIGLLREVPMLAPLALPALEQLGNGLRPVEVREGATVFHQGDRGDRYYVIESGEVEVVGDGQHFRTLGPGEGFGEIALLRDVPRTATVVARTDLRLESLTADVFVPVMTSRRPGARPPSGSGDRTTTRRR